MNIINTITAEEALTLDCETLELLVSQEEEQHQAFDWQVALALTSQYSTDNANGIECFCMIEDEIDFCSAN
tara:strand:- start:1571 stop:1783 length:213 start_codon:yes stop_codon:yes gene_type:complete